jgi:SAM-dependent methyltransferase
MFASSFENMQRCYWRYVAGGPLERRNETTVVDLSGPTTSEGYREIFSRPPFRYLSVSCHPQADIVLTDQYALPFPDRSIDLVLCGQTLAQCPSFWRLFFEMARIVSPEGYIFLVTPSSGPFCSGSGDYYRFSVDAYGALATYANLIETWLDERGPWHNAVGVFRRYGAVYVPRPISVRSHLPPIWAGPDGTDEEEAVRGSVSYLEVLRRLHTELRPRQYLEIGVRHGASLSLAQGPATGVDPLPDLDGDLAETTQLLRMTSDDFFDQKNETSPDLCFIDGLHLFEQVLRDFMNIERIAAPGALVVIDDIFPNHPAQGERDRRTRVWSGDVWRMTEVLRERRPDLFLLPLDAAPTGLLLVAGLDNRSQVLWDTYDTILSEAPRQIGPPRSVIERQGAVAPAGDIVDAVLKGLKGARAIHPGRDGGSPPAHNGKPDHAHRRCYTSSTAAVRCGDRLQHGTRVAAHDPVSVTSNATRDRPAGL